jgi:hypothetical protein
MSIDDLAEAALAIPALMWLWSISTKELRSADRLPQWFSQIKDKQTETQFPDFGCTLLTE